MTVTAKATKTILIIEDDVDIRDALTQILEFEGYDIASASNGKEALDVLRNSARPGLILLDLMMPVMDGWQFRAEQQQDKRLADIPVVIVSADGRIFQKATAIGAAGYLRKPVELEVLLNTVQRHFKAS
ncbi:MAG TPA: response regulator [Planctomycetota bacterium]|nr:response regulator [Planctomycetota bacterium]